MKNTVNIWKINNIIEQGYPLFFSVAVGGFLVFYNPSWLHEICVLNRLSGPYLTVFSICFSFLLASLSVLLGLGDNPFLRGLRQSGTLDLLIKYHWSCAKWCGCSIACGVIVLFWPKDSYFYWQGAIFIATGVGSILSTWRILKLFVKIIKSSGIN